MEIGRVGMWFLFNEDLVEEGVENFTPQTSIGQESHRRVYILAKRQVEIK